jgi:hypothetical protein
MTPPPAGHARPHRVPDQAHPGSSPAPRERAPPPDHGGGAPCRAERLRRPMVRRRSAGSGRRLTIRRRQHTHPAHRAVDQNGGSARVYLAFYRLISVPSIAASTALGRARPPHTYTSHAVP